MDEHFLPKTGAEECSRPSPKGGLPSGFPDIGSPLSQSTAHPITNGDIITTTTVPTSASYVNLIANFNERRRLSRCSVSAPSVFTDEKQSFTDSFDPRPLQNSIPRIVQQAFIGIALYLVTAVFIFLVSGNFKGATTFKPVDALYYTIVTLCTIGYGDITPNSTFTKLFTCVFILVGFGFIDILLNGLVTYICDRQEEILLSSVDETKFNAMVRTYMIDRTKGRMRIRMKVGLALAVVIGCIAVGTISVRFLENLNWVDSIYLSVTSVTTVGYGDYAFTTLTGRCFAIVWLLVSTLAVARAFLYLTELRIYKRNRIIAKWVLQRKITMGDLIAADINRDGSISKSEFVLFKLKEMGKVAEQDILEICNQFDSMDSANCGKITIADLMESD